MCIIAYVPKGKKLSKQQLFTMFTNNPHGAGLMYQNNGLVEIRKGFFTYEKLQAAYDAIPDTAGVVVVHCRIATAGKISAACCHPFPVSDDGKNLTLTKTRAELAIAHNGIIPFCEPKGGMQAAMSDTMLFTQKVLYPLRDSLDKKIVRELIDKAVSPSRLFIMSGEKIYPFGYWHKQDGIYFSNDSYKPRWSYLTATEYDDPIEQIQFMIDVTDATKTERTGILRKVTNGVKHLSDWCETVGRAEHDGILELYFNVMGLPEKIKQVAGHEITQRFFI